MTEPDSNTAQILERSDRACKKSKINQLIVLREKMDNLQNFNDWFQSSNFSNFRNYKAASNGKANNEMISNIKKPSVSSVDLRQRKKINELEDRHGFFIYMKWSHWYKQVLAKTNCIAMCNILVQYKLLKCLLCLELLHHWLIGRTWNKHKSIQSISGILKEE